MIQISISQIDNGFIVTAVQVENGQQRQTAPLYVKTFEDVMNWLKEHGPKEPSPILNPKNGRNF